MRTLASPLAILILSLTLAGCSGFWQKAMPILTDVIVKVIDAEQQLDAIEKGIDAYFKAHPEPDNESIARDVLAKARSSLRIALRAAHAAKSSGEGDPDQAFEDFKLVYQELVNLLGNLSIVEQDGTLTVGPHRGVKLLPLLALEPAK